MRTAMLIAAVALAPAVVAAKSPPEATPSVRVVAGFEWDDFAPRVGRGMALGEPVDGSQMPPGFRAKRYEKLADVGAEGFQMFYPRSSRDHAGGRYVRANATQGHFAWQCPWSEKQWAWRLGQLAEKSPGAWPPHEPWYDVYDHFFQRESQLYQQDFAKLDDWSAYGRLRLDVTSVGAPLKLGMRIRDGSGPLVRNKFSGIRTGLVTFTVPKDATVTCDYPLAEVARVCELNLRQIHRFNIRVNGFPAGEAPTTLRIDNIRLIAAGAEVKETFKLIAPDAPPAPFARKVDDDPPTVRDPEALKRAAGPVEPLGPITINPNAVYAGRLGHGVGHFGSSGATYFSTSRRAVVAYDNKRLCVVMGGQSEPRGGRGGTIAIASFDGGATWGPLTADDKDFTSLSWHLRSNFFADRWGNIYALGTPNCDSYNEGQDICLHRLCFTGKTWVDDRFAIVHQDGYKCPHTCTALMTRNGRLWAAWGDGFGGYLARYSDDDGYTFEPCKPATPRPTNATDRPFRDVAPRDWLAGAKPDTPPDRVLLWPTPTVPAATLAPFGDGVAVVGDGTWAVHDGKAWSPPRKIDGKKLGRGLTSVTVLGGRHLFVSRSAPYNNLGKETLSDLVVADLPPGEGDDAARWRFTQLEGANVSTAILTACEDSATRAGGVVYCFYVYKAADDRYEIRHRRFAGGKWAPAVTLATEARRVNHVAAGQFSPPDYAAVFWDQFIRQRGEAAEVMFMRVPAR